MLIRFVVSNFMSFKEETEFNMLPSKGNGSRSLTHHIKKTNSGVEVLKTAAIYGANAAGKSNLAKAISFLKSIVTSDVEFLVPQRSRFRLDENYLEKSSTFRIEYSYQGIHFDYAVEIHKGKIIEEWLYLIESVDKSKEELLFERKDDKITFGKYFNDKEEVKFVTKFLKKQLKDNETVLNTCYLVFDNNNILDKIVDAFSKIHIIYPSSYNTEYAKSIFLGEKKLEFANKILSESATGIEKIVIAKIPANDFFGIDDENFKNKIIDQFENLREKAKEEDKEKKALVFQNGKDFFSLIKEDNKYLVLNINTKHEKSNFPFDFSEESDGTNRLFELSPALEELIFEDDVTFVIDELERSIHPLLAKQLLKLYSESSKTNSQLIFTTHESHLLDDELLRRDEIWFTEKKADGSTEFYPLSNFNPRGDKVLERGYLQGRYGGIPFLGDFSKLVKEEF
ncbi:MAG: ATP-binding protein [Limnohabitans sp.]|nr:ATP-binding protein [Limnohabitans sp.]